MKEDRRVNMQKKYAYIIMKIKVNGYTFVWLFVY